MVKLRGNILKSVQKPARYVGGEYGQVIKNKNNVKFRFAFCFPDTYEIGMSNLGIRILYNVLNQRRDTWCERVYTPWIDMEARMRENNIPLYAHESKDELKEFSMVGFTLQYEMSYTNILNMLDLAGMEVCSKDRKETDPFIIAGGPCACNPAPIAPYIDFFLIGEGEEIFGEIIDKYNEWKASGKLKREYLESIKDITGVYIPSIHDENSKIQKRIIKDMDTVMYPTNFVVPSTDIVHDRIMLEVFRGCTRGCRFCQAGYIYRPVREKSVDVLTRQAKESLINTGIDEVSLSSLSTSDYPCFVELAEKLLEIGKDKKMSLSLPSLRIDSMNVDILKKVQEVRKSGLTFAPEAGTQRLRDVINKNITKEDIMNSCKLAFENGWSTLKLYFMIGLPTETYEDLDGIAELTQDIVNVYNEMPKEQRKGRLNITVSTSTFVPKANTPFQWVGQDTMESVEAKQKYLMNKLKIRGVRYKWHSSKVSVIEANIARGGIEIAPVILDAWKNGAKLDSWDETFKEEVWVEAFKKNNIDMQEYAARELPLDAKLPWDNIFVGVEKDFLKREYAKALEEQVTMRCSEDHCAACGVTKIAKCKFLNKKK
ncbi:MAG: TIGR03960 family B12-binding radical SAM protein [Clostridia bacterium]